MWFTNPPPTERSAHVNTYLDDRTIACFDKYTLGTSCFPCFPLDHLRSSSSGVAAILAHSRSVRMQLLVRTKLQQTGLSEDLPPSLPLPPDLVSPFCFVVWLETLWTQPWYACCQDLRPPEPKWIETKWQRRAIHRMRGERGERGERVRGVRGVRG